MLSLGELGETLANLQSTVANVSQKYGALMSRYDQTKIALESYLQLFDSLPDAVVITRTDGLIDNLNLAAVDLLRGDSPQDGEVGRSALIHQPFSQFLQSEFVAPFLQATAQPQPTPCSLEVNLRSCNGTSIQAVLRGRQLLQPESAPTRLCWMIHDISEQKRIERRLQMQAEQERLILMITQRIRQSLDPKKILNSTVAEVRRLLQADRVIIYSFEAVTDAVVVAEAVEPDWISLLGSRISQALAALQVNPQDAVGLQAIADTEAANYPNPMLQVLQQQQIRAALVVPLERDGHLLGFLSVHQCASIRYWQPFEVELLQHLSEQVAIALQQSNLYQQAQQLNADLEEQVRRRTEQMEQVLKYESMLKRITDKVRDSLDENQILQAAVQELTLVLGLAGCNSALYDLDQNTSTILYEYTHSIPTFYGRVAQMDVSPEIYHQLKQGYYFQFCSLYPNPERGQVAMLACPIFVDPASSQGIEQTVLGDLWLIHRKEYVFNEFEIRLVQQVANQCAIAIRQARLYQAAQVQVQELERLNQLKDQFLSTVSHELRTPIANVKMALHMLKTTLSKEKRAQYLSILESEIAREAELIDDLLDLQRLEESVSSISVEPIHLSTWLPQLVEPFRTRTVSYQQSLEVLCPPNLPTLFTEPTILRRILAELMNNACKYTPKQQSIELKVDYQPATADSLSYSIFILKNQAEIPLAELPHIFEKFYRVLQIDRYKHGGTGLGLALVQKLVEQLDGTIQADSANGWTTFTVKIPSLEGKVS